MTTNARVHSISYSNKTSYNSQIYITLDLLDDDDVKKWHAINNELQTNGHPRFRSLFSVRDDANNDTFSDYSSSDKTTLSTLLVATLPVITIGHTSIYNGLYYNKDHLLDKYCCVLDVLDQLKELPMVNVELSLTKNLVGYPTLSIITIALI